MPSRRTFAAVALTFAHSEETSLRNPGSGRFPTPLDWHGQLLHPIVIRERRHEEAQKQARHAQAESAAAEPAGNASASATGRGCGPTGSRPTDWEPGWSPSPSGRLGRDLPRAAGLRGARRPSAGRDRAGLSDGSAKADLCRAAHLVCGQPQGLSDRSRGKPPPDLGGDPPRRHRDSRQGDPPAVVRRPARGDRGRPMPGAAPLSRRGRESAQPWLDPPHGRAFWRGRRGGQGW